LLSRLTFEEDQGMWNPVQASELLTEEQREQSLLSRWLFLEGSMTVCGFSSQCLAKGC
jgi:hypothetical protein